MKKTFLLSALVVVSLLVWSCDKHEADIDPDDSGWVYDPDDDDGDIPDFDETIHDYDGERATDSDTPGTDEDIYWEANNFKTKITVAYSGSTAEVVCSESKVQSHVSGAHVVIDMETGGVSGAEIEISGKSDDGSLKIYGGKKYKLTLNGVELSSKRGPAINSQCKKRCFVHLADGTVNRLTDAAAYADDTWYIDGSTSAGEDRKGCFFAEGHLIFSGRGVLVVAGRQKHGIATDGYMYTRPGSTIAVTEAAKNGIQVKGDEGDDMGLTVTGGLLYVNVASEAGKCIKSDLHADIRSGKLDLNTSGNAVYDTSERDTSSAAGIKTDGDIRISGGEMTVKSTGTGGKGLNADGMLTVSGGTTTLTTSGGQYKYSSSVTSSPKGVTAEGDIHITGGTLNISVTGRSEGSEGLESKSTLTIDNGRVYSYAYDDAINADKAVVINGGRVYAYAVNNDGIDSNGTLTLNGGLVIASGSAAPEEGFDCDRSTDFTVTGGTLIGTGGAAIAPSTATTTQRTVIYNGISATKDELLAILDASGKPILVYALPRSMNSMALFVSTPDIAAGAAYSVVKGGSVSGSGDEWCGWYSGGTWSGGSQVGTFTSSSMITTIGNSSGPGGGGPGGPGGGRP